MVFALFSVLSLSMSAPMSCGCAEQSLIQLMRRENGSSIVHSWTSVSFESSESRELSRLEIVTSVICNIK
jgi:hypothetical protein